MKKEIEILTKRLKKDVKSYDYKLGVTDFYNSLDPIVKKNDELIKELVEALENAKTMIEEYEKEHINKNGIGSDYTGIKTEKYNKIKQLLTEAKEVL